MELINRDTVVQYINIVRRLPSLEVCGVAVNPTWIVTHDDWEELKASIDAFFAQVTPEQLSARQEQINQREIDPDEHREFNARSVNMPNIADIPIDRFGYIYVLKAGPYYKIGRTRNVDNRIKQLSTIPPFDLELVTIIPTDDMYALESQLHAELSDKRKNGEWFELDRIEVNYLKGLGES